MIINLIKSQQMYSITLPEKVRGQYWVTYQDQRQQTVNMISVEAENGVWIVKSNKHAWLTDSNGKRVEAAQAKLMSVLPINFRSMDGTNKNVESALLFCEPIASGRQQYKKYIARSVLDITIGRADDNDLVFKHMFVSSRHARLSFNGTNWFVTDENSGNGTFVNGLRVNSTQLSVGDCIYIMGLKIIIGSNFFALNNPDQLLSVKAPVSQFVCQQTEQRESSLDSEVRYFYRSPRFKRAIETSIIEIDPPPQSQRPDSIPLGLMLGPALTMGLSSSSMGFFMVYQAINNNGSPFAAIPSATMSISMLLGSILWPLLTKKHEKKKMRTYEKMREEKYLYYLNTLRDEIKRKSREQIEILKENYPTAGVCAEMINEVNRGLWGRMKSHDDFLCVRLGTGELPFNADISYPIDGFSLEDDHLKNAMNSLKIERKILSDVPIGLSLTDNFLTGILGERATVLAFMRSLLLQMVSLHSYDEVKIVLIYRQDEAPFWEYARFLNHVWNNEKTERYIASNADEIKELTSLLEKALSSREESEDAGFRKYSTYYVVISADKALFERSELLQSQVMKKANNGVSVIMLYDEMQNLPKETISVIQVEGEKSLLFNKNDITGNSLRFSAEYAELPQLLRSVGTLANIRLDIAGQQATLPTMLNFLEMFNVGKIEHLNPLTRWKENDPTVTLQTPIGVDSTGELFYLDLHEKFQGPHGLIAGTTGSGKSEFIITYIISMAVNYHPDEVAFVLIDYKGGGLAGAFENVERGIKLPHLAGTITNLDGAAINRSLVSIQSELKRRQAIFNEARDKIGEGTMDIYKYQKLYRENLLDKPVPHLFIISDEFAELKSQQPEFMDQLISAARIGRSLGVHLILATQKPAGVVNDQIWSNSRFRVCLKVQEKADSMDMIKCPDAAELSQTGRFYLQVGFNELFAMGQSAWCGADYFPSEQVDRKVDSSVQVVNNLGRVVKDVKHTGKVPQEKAKTTQIVSLVEYLSVLASEENVVPTMLWLPPIPAVITVDELNTKYSHETQRLILDPVIGEYDDPANQRQALLTLPITREGNCIIYGSTGSGKKTFLTTVIYSLLRTHDVSSLNLYIIDYGAETLRAFAAAPHVGDVVISADTDKTKNLFRMLRDELVNRKSQFSEYGGDFQTYCKSTGHVVPNIVVVLNNYGAFIEAHEDLQDMFNLLSQDGIQFGIYFVITSGSASAIRYRTQQNFKQIFVLQQNDASDYTVLLGKTEGLIPSRYKGRGLVRTNRLYEFQTAYCDDMEDPYEFLQLFCKALASQGGVRAKKIPVLPEVVNTDFFKDETVTLAHVPVGVLKTSLATAYLDISARYILPVLSQDSYQLDGFARELYGVFKLGGLSVQLIDGENAAQKAEVDLMALYDVTVDRHNRCKAADMDVSVLDGDEEKVVILSHFNKIYEKLSMDDKDKCKEMLEKGQALHKLHFILTDISSQFGMFTGEAWYRTHIPGDGLWIGEGFTSQYILKINKMSNDMYTEIGETFGYWINKGKSHLCKLLSDNASAK